MLAYRDGVNKERLIRFLEEHGNTFSKLEVLLFLSRHPQAKFSFDAIAGSRGARRLELADGVKSLVQEGIVRVEVGDKNAVWFSLTSNQSKRKCVEELTELDSGSVKKYWRECCWTNRC